jgi:hypothetical protein
VEKQSSAVEEKGFSDISIIRELSRRASTSSLGLGTVKGKVEMGSTLGTVRYTQLKFIHPRPITDISN